MQVVNVSCSLTSDKLSLIAKRGNKLDTSSKSGRNVEENTGCPCSRTSSGCSRPYQGSQWATFHFFRFYPTSSSLFEQSLLSSTTNHLTLQDSATQKSLTQAQANDTGRAHSSSLPERPSVAPPPRRIMVPHKSQPRDQVPPIASTSIANKHHTSMDNSPRPTKRLKDDQEDMDISGPSLLSRLTSNGSGSRAATTKRTFTSQVGETSADLPHPPGGWSIKGAAKLDKTPSSPERMTDLPQRFSLLDRLEGGSPAGSGTPGGRGKKTWG